jgi:predicted TIM-barrel fold metal-dependent hydrolase
LDGPLAAGFLARLEKRGWFAQVFADDTQWQAVASVLSRSGVKVLVDHFGLRDPSAGLSQKGFQAVLTLGREGRGAVKLSAPFRLSQRLDDFADLDPYAEALIEAFGVEACIWGSDWPFINFPNGFTYEAALHAVERWLPRASMREAVMGTNAARLFGFGA